MVSQRLEGRGLKSHSHKSRLKWGRRSWDLETGFGSKEANVGGGISDLRGDGKSLCQIRNRNVTRAGKRSAGNAVFPAGYQCAYARARQLAGVSKSKGKLYSRARRSHAIVPLNLTILQLGRSGVFAVDPTLHFASRRAAHRWRVSAILSPERESCPLNDLATWRSRLRSLRISLFTRHPIHLIYRPHGPSLQWGWTFMA